MPGWKDKLKEIKSTIKVNRDSQKQLSMQNENGEHKNATEWIAGVNPLANKTESKANAFVHNGNEKRQARSPSSKSKIRRYNDTLPSDETITSVYGRGKPRKKVDAPARPSASVKIPPVEEFPRVSLASLSTFKMPDEWVSAGLLLNHPEGGQGRLLRIRMGIDFGTSYTKVAIRFADKVYFLEWDGLHGGDSTCLLPGEISHMRSGAIQIGAASDAITVTSGLKTPFLSTSPPDHHSYIASTAFLAWVMRYSRAWLYRNHPDLLRSRRLAWEINIGSPTAPWFMTSVVQQYENVAKSAWKLSQVDGDMTDETVLAVLHADKTIDEVGLDDVGIVPEFVAQIAGYVKSPQRKEGLFLLADIGAGTVDIAAFNIHRNSDEELDRFPIFEGAVTLMGTHVLMATRLNQNTSPAQVWDDAGGIPSLDQLAIDMDISKEKLQEVDTYFSNQISQEVSKILRKTKSTRYPRAPEWKDGMSVFLAGGGSNCDVYKIGVRKAFEGLRIPPIITPFPKFSDAVTKSSDEEFHRLSVAYGLTFDATTLGKVIRPQEIEDIPSTTVPASGRPDRDEI